MSSVDGAFHSAASYTARQEPGDFHVIATSHANSNRRAIIEIAVGGASFGAGNSFAEQIVGTWQWPRPSDDLHMEISSDGSAVLSSDRQPGQANRGTYKISADKNLQFSFANGDTLKWQVLSGDGGSMRVMSSSKQGVSAMTLTKIK